MIGVHKLEADLRSLGLRHDQDVLVHCAMSQIGWIDGAAPALMTGIRRVVGDGATIVVPTHTTINSPTSRAFRSATKGMTPDQVARFIAQLTGFDHRSRTSEMGLLAEYVLSRDDAVRSAHPLVSFAAVGPRAAQFMAVHELESHLGELSPMGALYAAGAVVLLLGVGYDGCSALHLAEYRLRPLPPIREYSCFVIEEGRRVLKVFSAVDLDDRDFVRLGKDFEAATNARPGMVGAAASRVVGIREAVDFAVGWMTDNRRDSLTSSNHSRSDVEPAT